MKKQHTPLKQLGKKVAQPTNPNDALLEAVPNTKKISGDYVCLLYTSDAADE